MDVASTLDETIRADLLRWIAAIAQPDDRLGGHAICPFAHLARNTFILDVDEAIVPPDAPFDVVIYVLPLYCPRSDPRSNLAMVSAAVAS